MSAMWGSQTLLVGLVAAVRPDLGGIGGDDPCFLIIK